MSFKRHLVISEFTDAVNSRHGTDALSSYSKIKENIIPLFYALGAIRLGRSRLTAFRTFFSQAPLALKKAPPASARSRSNAKSILILANCKIKENIIPLFYALGAIRLEFAPRSRRLACCAYAQAVSFRSLSGFVPVALHPSANSPNALTRHSPCARSTNPVKTDKTKDRLKPILCFMRLARFERATYPLKGECSTC